jgi:hypothetical protein
MNQLLSLALAGLFASNGLAAQEGEAPAREIPNAGSELAAWRAAHGDAWRTVIDQDTGFAEMIYGGNVPALFRPKTDSNWISVARDFLTQAGRLHGVDAGSLVHDESSVHFLPLAMAPGGTDKMTVNFTQKLGTLDVVDGSVRVLMDMQGRLLSIQSTASPFLEEIDTHAMVSAADAWNRAAATFTQDTGLQPMTSSDPVLVIKQANRVGLRLPYLSWQIDMRWDGGVPPEAYTYWIDAHDGSLVDKANRIHFDVGGTLDSMATPGTHPDKTNNPEVAIRLPYARITAGANTTYTDRNGVWNFVGLSGPLSCTFEYRGLYNRVLNAAGAEYTLVVNASTGSGNAILMNPASDAATTAAANAYLGVNVVRDFVRDTNPADAHADFLALSNVNINSSCNAYYDGGSINFYIAAGGCVNTAYSTVVAHEYGHWLNDKYSTGNGGDGMGEGNADVWAMYTWDDPIVGFDFCGTGCHVRDGRNTRQFCGDCCGGCYGEVHADGEVWMGAAWKVRDRLNTSLGNSAGDLVADTIFVGWMNAYNQQTIKSVIETQWLTLDDNDGNITNGTPHYADIDGGFVQQGFPGIPLQFVVYSNVTDLADTLDETGPYVVNANIVANIAPPITNATLFYRVNVGSYVNVPMTPTGGNNYTASIPGQTAPSDVDYYLSASDSGTHTVTYPDGAPNGNFLNFRVGPVTDFLITSFEAGTNEGWTVGDTGDNATSGQWVRVDPNGTAAQPDDDHTPPTGVKCWVTGQGSAGGALGQADVDGGKTTLKSPIFDASGPDNARIRYWRWFDNDKGTNPNQDVFTVDISNNGGASWTNVEVVGPNTAESKGGWFLHHLVIQDVIAPTSTMQLRFVAADTGNASNVEAAIDDVEGYSVGDACPNPTGYGQGKLNSQFESPEITFTGQNSFAANDFVFHISTLIPHQGAILISGSSQTDVPFYGGSLYVGGGIVREALFFLDNGGSAAIPFPIDFSDIGTTRYFQIWYRDPTHWDGTGVGLSNGMAVPFCD